MPCSHTPHTARSEWAHGETPSVLPAPPLQLLLQATAFGEILEIKGKERGKGEREEKEGREGREGRREGGREIGREGGEGSNLKRSWYNSADFFFEWSTGMSIVRSLPPPLPSNSPSSTTRKYKARVTAWKTAGSAPFTWSSRVSQTVLCKGILREVCRSEGVRE